MNSMQILLLLCVLLPIAAAPVVYFLHRRNEKAGYLVTDAVCLVVLVATAVLLRAGEVELALPHVFLLGLSFSGIGFKNIFALLGAYLFFMSAMASPAYFRGSAHTARYNAFLLLTLGGILGVFYGGDLFTIYIFFETMSLASWVWVAQTESDGARRAADTYLAMAMIGGLTMLYGLFVLYHQFGTLSLSELQVLCSALEDKHSLFLPAICLLVGFGIKAGMFPFHVWLPKAHPVAPAPASALLSGILTKSGIFGIVLIVTCLMWGNVSFMLLLLVVGVITMVLGAVLAVFSLDLKRTLACSSLSQIGFLLTGAAMLTIGVNTELAAAGIMCHAINHALTKLILFVSAGVLYKNTHTLDLNELQGAGRKSLPLLICFAIGALSIAGLPGFGGYISKTLLHESFAHQMHHMHSTLLLIARCAEALFLCSGGLTLAYMGKLFYKIFLQKPLDDRPIHIDTGSLLAIVPASAALLIMGLLPSQTYGAIAAYAAPSLRSAPIVVDYFSWQNLEGATISITIGLIVYFFVVRLLLTRREDGHYRRIAGPIDLEDDVYRPALSAVAFVGALLGRIVYSITDWLTAALHYLFRVGNTRRIVPGEDDHFGRYRRKSTSTNSIRQTLQFELLLFGIGVVAALFYLLLRL